MADTYVKKIRFEADTKQLEDSVKAFEKNLSTVEKQVDSSFSSPLRDSVKTFSRSFKDAFKESFGIAKTDVDRLKEQLADISDSISITTKKREAYAGILTSKDATDEEKADAQQQYDLLTRQLNNETKAKLDAEQKLTDAKLEANKQMYAKLGKVAGEKLGKIISNIGDAFKGFLKDMFTEALGMLEDIASYNLETTTKFNQQAVDLAVNYGLTGAEAYSTQKAAEQMGYGSVDTLIENMWNMNDAQKERFNKLQEQYKKSYEQDMELAQKYQEFTAEWEDFKKNFQMELLEWFSNNKDTIKSVLKLLMNFMKVTLKLLSAIADAFGVDAERTSEERLQASSDIVNSYKTANTNNVSISNTFNVSGTTTQTENQLSKIGSNVYRQFCNVFR